MSAPDAELLRELLLERYEPIAIVGIGLRLPGDNEDPAGLADFLRSGGSGIGPVPANRWDVGRFASDDGGKGKIRAAGGGFLAGMDQFDPRFFGISPREAQYMDPQARLVLETGWEALEHAGIDPHRLRRSDGGVYVGVSCVDYPLEVEALAFPDLDAYIGTGTAHSAIPGRLSYFLGWRGPSMAIDTACSSSLVALHLAVEGLRRKECSIALCAGVNAIHHPRNHVVFSQAGMLSPDGFCKTFDDRADGYSRSEGCGVVVLKRYSDAKRDGDRILALVRGTAVRQDGESGGLTVPNGSAQGAVMRAALANAMVEPADVQYVEAHGTGTSLGDPIEVGAIHSVFAASHTQQRPVLIGSLKGNIGHMEAAAGIGGVIKTVLQLVHQEIFPHVGMTEPSRHIPWSTYPVSVPVDGLPWTAPTRRALVNSFGFAGTISSVLLEQAPPAGPAGAAEVPGRPYVLALSGRTEAALENQAARYREYLAAHPETVPADLCYTAAVCRADFAARTAVVVRDNEEIAAALAKPAPAAQPAPAKVAFLFTGQGSQYVGMGRALYHRYPVFRDRVDECDRLFAAHLGESIRDLMFDGEPGCVDETRYTQPALFTVEYAAAMLWRSFGIEPDVLIGHSIGEIVAATVAGLFRLPDAVRLVAVRARLMQSVTAPGGMVAVSAPADEIAPLIAGFADVSFAAFNAPGQCVVSGGVDALAEITTALSDRGVRTRRLSVSHAFHSPLMREVAEQFRRETADVRFGEIEMTFVSNVTGRIADPEQVGTIDYWVRHLAEPVDFAAGIGAVDDRGEHVFIEVGPAPTLTAVGRRCTPAGRGHRWLSSMRAGDEDGSVLLESVAAAYGGGLRIDWTAVFDGIPARRLDLPTYPFEHRRYWLPLKGARHERAGLAASGPARHPLLGEETTTAEQSAEGIREFRTRIGPADPAYLADHVVMDQVVFPAAGYVEMMLAAQDAVHGETSRPLRDVQIREPLLLSEERLTEVHVRLRRGADDAGAASIHEVEILSLDGAGDGAIERRHAVARIADETVSAGEHDAIVADLRAAAAATGADDRDGADLYPEWADLGLMYGPQFQRIRWLRRVDAGTAVAELRGLSAGALEHLPPVLLDNVIQSLGGVIDDGQTYLPVRFGWLRLLSKPRGRTLRAVVRRTGESVTHAGEFEADLLLLDGDRVVVLVRGLGFRRVARTGERARSRMFHRVAWLKRALVRTGTPGDRRLILANRSAAEMPLLAERLAADGVDAAFAGNAEAVTAVLDRRPTDVCWVWRPSADGDPVTRLRSETEDNFRDLLSLVSAVDGHDVRLYLVTEGAQHLPGDPAGLAVEHVAASTVWGFGLSLWSEYPALRVTLLDVPSAEADAERLLAEVYAGEDEYQVAHCPSGRHVRRILPHSMESPEGGNAELAVKEYGSFDGVGLVPVPDVPPVDDQIEVQVRAAGLNFKDVLNALGLLRQHAADTGMPYAPLPLGFEGSGTVVAAGPRAAFAVGDDVVLSHIGSMRRRVTVPSAHAVPMPEGLSYVDAAALPTAYITAFYALHRLAGMTRGDRVLIHAGAGGVGQAAIRLARAAGAEIFATASPHKHPVLREQGVTHVLNSRSLDFAGQVLELTGGAGVDIVLNSLNKDYIEAGMRALGHGGRFVELGKIGAWSADRAAAHRPDVAYHHFDLSEFPDGELRRINHEILTEVVDGIAAGRLSALPTTAYTLDEVDEAFAVLSRGANIGKLVLSLDAEPATARPVAVRADRTYLITGGLGALGRLAAVKLAELGARRLALVSRREPDPEDLAALHKRLPDGVDVRVHRADIAQPEEVRRLFRELADGASPLGGVVHAAGVLADRPVARMTWEDVQTVCAPKVLGTWLLHEAVTPLAELDFFVAYSSVASVIGSVGQANYAAGNAFVDALMVRRAAAGRPGSSVNWGPWAEVGMAAGLEARLVRNLEAQGTRFIRPGPGAAALATVVQHPLAQVVVGEFDWDRMAAGRAANPLYQRVARRTGNAADVVDVEQLARLPKSERRTALNRLIRAHVASALHFDGADDVPADAKFLDVGLDSLGAVELKNFLESSLRVALPTGLAFDYPSIELLAENLGEQLDAARGEDALPEEPSRAGRGVVGEMTADEVAAELDALKDL
ncbi:type I polyketide synthase [Mangrovihabitans endophyticus]|uniref:Polyketide synthase n=1 Tax=Mangrovihabitans endophyticus TaxID=1751298 RepID=A0A8J3BX84_9ACTN|nr:type I polyketide synthase [Mangrovihabitans endophyticus]GGK86767.1 polyketide synthase [Mangrovihabitans endophyticus]